MPNYAQTVLSMYRINELYILHYIHFKQVFEINRFGIIIIVIIIMHFWPPVKRV